MIINAILTLIYGVVYTITAIFRILPNVSLPANILNSMVSLGTYINSLDFIFPISTFFTIFGLYITIETSIVLLKITNWIIRKIPTVN